MTNNRYQCLRSQKRGFSLAELLVVIVIIGFASSVAILSYTEFRQANTVRSESEKLRSMLINARTRAIASGNASQVVFDLDRRIVWIDDLDATANNIVAPKVVPPELLHQDVMIAGVRIGGATEATLGTVTAKFTATGNNPFLTVALRRVQDDPAIDANYYSIQLYPSSSEPKVWPNERR